MFTHSPSHSLTRSLNPAHKSPSGTERERKRFPFLTPITHELLIPYDGCQSPAVYISSTLLHPLIFLSSLPCDYSYFLFFSNIPKGIRRFGGLQLYYIYFFVRCMDGQTGNMIVQLYRESRSVLALTAGDVRGKSIGEGKGEALVGRSVETHAQWM